MNIVVRELDDSINIQLLNVALVFEFFINLICVIKMMKKEVHWDIQSQRLHRKEIIFCVVESIEDHWVLENNFSDQTFETFEAKSETSKSDLMITSRKWHEMLEHSRSKIIAHLAEKINEIKVDDFESTFSINKCKTCALIKTHEIVSRRIDQKESIDHSLNRIDYDLISMNEKYNDDYWINHFVYFRIRINFVYTHSRKNDAFSMIREFLKTTRIKYDQIVRFIKMNDERTLRLSIENLWNCERSSRNDSSRIRHLRMIKSNNLKKYWWSELTSCE
jgi:excinuclease UvrABC ATPase subunit